MKKYRTIPRIFTIYITEISCSAPQNVMRRERISSAPQNVMRRERISSVPKNIYSHAERFGTFAERFITVPYRGAGIFAAKTPNDTAEYYVRDPHGSTVRTVKADGTTVAEYEYDAFGNQLTNTDNANPFLYCGEYYDEETGLIYLRNRYYDPSIGRFITEDPAKDGMNWYVYCDNNPVNLWDPLGLEYLVVSGSEYDGIPKINSRYKYNFIEPAITKLKELKALDDGESITWVVSKTGYSEESLGIMGDVANSIGVGIQFIESAAELQNYMNSKDKTMWNLSSDRLSDPIRKIAFFSHGVPGRVELGHGLYNNRQLSIDFNFIQGLFSEAFDNPNTAFYSCRAGTNATSQWGSNTAQDWVNKVGGRTWATTGRTMYDNIIVGEGDIGRANRDKYGFNINGSPNYPVASNGIKSWMNFYRPSWFVN